MNISPDATQTVLTLFKANSTSLEERYMIMGLLVDLDVQGHRRLAIEKDVMDRVDEEARRVKSENIPDSENIAVELQRVIAVAVPQRNGNSLLGYLSMAAALAAAIGLGWFLGRRSRNSETG